MRVYIPILFLFTAQFAEAGAWAREKGEIFLSFSQRLSGDPVSIWTGQQGISSTAMGYLEYGLTPNLTFVAEGDYSATTQAFSGALGLRRGFGTGPTRFAVSALAGADGPAASSRATLGVHVGHGFDLGTRPGWIAMDTSLIWANSAFAQKADLTMGVSLTSKLKAMVQVQYGLYGTAPAYARVGPGLVWSIRSGTDLVFSAEKDLMRPRHYGVTAGLWRTF